MNDEGKKNTIEKLKYIGKEYRVLHYRNIQGGGGIQEFDHIVIGPNGVFHIDSRYWNGDIKFTDEGVERSKEAYTEDPTSELHRHNFVMRELLKKSHPETDVVGLLCFTHPDCQLSGSSSGFNTMKLDRLIYAIKSYKPKNKLNSTQVREIEKVIKKNSNNVK
ncbi:nuclease-related domain-containing protein [Paenibacillus eucommiae]|uniref:nuclease-related domain-containing protein n=1 Tax=Paenibacillus eucommiae TaxID=1355755 RepID=UPI002479856A|nr:nuclease-related domain-containing protein [Paenibacillus eucommiae]